MKSYPKYKPSGIEWIGDIPEHWEIKKLSHGFKKIGSGTTPTAGNEGYYLNGEYNWLQTGDLKNEEINYTSKKITQKALDDFSTLRFYKPGSVAIAMYGATIGKTGILNIETTTNQACCVLSEPNAFESKYVFYWFNANKNTVISLSYGGGQPNISQEIIKAIRISYPPKEEQTAIVNYLDEKIAQIDNLITQKKKLIELLKEERIAVINRAEKAKLSNIIDVLNDKYSTDFTEADRLYFEQLEQALFDNDELKLRAQNNPIENFKYAFEDVFIQTLIDRMNDNQEIFDKIMENKDFKMDVKDWLTKKIYQRFNDASA